jgi:hypothetical protein
VAAVQAMVDNLAAEREAVVAFLHTIVDEVSADLGMMCRNKRRLERQSLRGQW